MLTVKRGNRGRKKIPKVPVSDSLADRKEERERERGKGMGERWRMDRIAENPRRMELE